MINEKPKKKNKVTIIALAILLLIMIVGTSFALWQLTFTQSGTNVITTGCLNLTLTDDTDAINLADATPTSDVEGKKLTPYTFTLENTCNTDAAYVINLETVSSGDKILADNYVKANLVKGTDEVFLDKLVVSHENQDKVITEASKAYMLNQGKLAGKEKVQFSLRLWMAEETEAIDSVMNASWQGKITVTASYVPVKVENDKELYNIVKKQASLDNVASEFVTSPTGIDFKVAPSDTNGKGVYTIASTKDDTYPVHYFRGEVANNNVKFANFCWKIVRTTETGGVKLIYNGTPNETGGCTNTTGEATQIGTSKINEDSYSKGYMNPETTNETNSAIKTAIDTWYQNNMTDYTKYLEDTIWCNDRSVHSGDIDDIMTTKASYRNTALFKPSIVCPNDTDKFTVSSEHGNGKLTYPVALLTADEATLAGQGNQGYSSNNYLYTNQTWWTMSFSHVDVTGTGVGHLYNFYVSSDGDLSTFNGYVNSEYGVRPSISLVPGVVVSNGNGTANFPYEILLQE